MANRFIFLMLALGAVVVGKMAPDAAAQEMPPAAPVVRQIEVQYAGTPTVSRERVIANMRTRVGEPYSDQLIEEDIRNLYASGTVANVRIFAERLGDGVKVVVVVQTKAAVNEVRLEGVSQVKEARLRKELQVKPGEVLNEARLEEDRRKILEIYQGRGFSDTDVKYDVRLDEATGQVTVVYQVFEGGKQFVAAIEFEGNTVFKRGALRKQIKTRPRNILSFLTKEGRVQSERLQEDAQAVREYYQNNGYVDAVVEAPRIEPMGGSKVRVVFPIREGRQYTVGRVSVSGTEALPADDVRAKVTTAPGDIYSPKKARDDVKAIQDLYGTLGYVDLTVNAETVASGAGVVDLNFAVEEGVPAYLERVNITGNSRTKDKVIRRELLVAPGDLYNTVRVDASKQRLQNLNYFSRVDLYPSETGIPGRKDLNILVEEKRTGSLNFGAGFSSIDNLIGFAELQQSNFDVTNWPSFTGGGQRFRMRIQYGTERQDFVVSLTEPYFLDYQFSLGGELFYRSAQFVSDVYSQRNYGVELTARKAINDFTSVRLSYRLENIGIFDIDADASDEIRSQEGDKLKSGLSATLTYDTRDSLFLTRKGERVDFSLYGAGGLFGGDVDTWGFSLEASKYLLLPWDTILLLNGEVASVDTWGGGEEVPIFDRLYLGGANNLRGFRFRDVGPKDENGEPIGGQTLARLTVEYTFPVIERVRGAIFYDVGFVNRSSYDFGGGNVNSDVGIGVRLDLPIGPVRIDYGIPMQADEFNDSGGRFNFNIGYQF